MSVYRFGRWRYRFASPLVRKPLSALYHLLFKAVQIVTGIELPCEVRIGRNFVIDHFGGIVVSGYASFGDNCRIRQGVSVGLASVDDPCAPQIGHNVDIGCGAKLLGRIVIGDDVSIGANAVVLTDVPSHSIAVGVPAVVKRKAPPPLKTSAVTARKEPSAESATELATESPAGSAATSSLDARTHEPA